jgi:hypothetical protein
MGSPFPLPFPCFRGCTSLPPWEGILGEEKAGRNLKKTFRIECRKTRRAAPGAGSFLGHLLRNEKKIERVLRSKSGLDGLFELCPMAPWRQTGALEVPPEEGAELLVLDFRNFYPSILCGSIFVHPASLRWTKDDDPLAQDAQPGLWRVILTPKDNAIALLKDAHPFQLQWGKKSCPFALAAGLKIDTLIHTAEAGLWSEWFEVETHGGLVGEPISHPLKNRVARALHQLQALRNDAGESDREQISNLKVEINAATTTPKIGTDPEAPSPHGVHCLPSQIVATGRALMTALIVEIKHGDPEAEVLQINTDGLVVKTRKPSHLEAHLGKLMGPNPGQLKLAARGKAGFFLGPNTWWLLDEDGKIIVEKGTGRSQEQIETQKVIPQSITYADATGETQSMRLLHLADWRHRLEKYPSSKRRKFPAEEFLGNHHQPRPPSLKKGQEEMKGRLTESTLALPAEEKQKSWERTAAAFNSFRQRQERR